MKKLLLQSCVYLLNFAFLSSAIAQTFKGELDILVFDYFNKNKSTTTYRLHEGNDIYVLNLPKTLKKNNLFAGEQVIVEGELITGLKQDQINVNSISITDTSSKFAKKGLVGNRNILAVLVNFNDKKATNVTSTSKVDNQLYANRQSVRRNYALSSDGQLQFLRDATNPGIYTVNLNYDAGNACNYDAWSKDAETAVQSKANLSSFTHHMFILPSNVNCPWAGLGNVGCATNNCKTWIVGEKDMKLVMAHELGHNLGMHHSSTDINNKGVIDEYGDASCVMGNSGYRRINAPHRDQMQWFAAYPNRIATINTAGEYVIHSLDISTDALQVLRINKKDQSGTYYISYRSYSCPFGMGGTYWAQVNLHRTDSKDNHSYFIKTLRDSEEFVDESNGITISIISTDLNSRTAQVAVNITK